MQSNFMELFQPDNPFILQWNKTFLLCSLVSFSLDPLFLYIPVVNGTQNCVYVDRKLAIVLSVLRSFVDVLYLCHIIINFRTMSHDPLSHITNRKYIDEPWNVAKRYLTSYFIIDVLAALPLPQLAALIITESFYGPNTFSKETVIKTIILFLYVPRAIQASLFYKKMTKDSVFLLEKAWAGAAFNFFLYVLASHRYLQSYSNLTLRTGEMKEKSREAEDLMSYMNLPDELRKRVRSHKKCKWKTTHGVDLDPFVEDLPRDIRRDIRRHLCLPLLKRIPLFEVMNDHLLDAMCDRLKAVLYTKGSCLLREDDPVHEMLFFTHGKLECVDTNSGRKGFFNKCILTAGDFCGEQLLTWALDSKSQQCPFSTMTVRALTYVQGFTLVADDILFIASQFSLFRSRQFRHIFRCYSQQWRTWAACYIQAAWRRHYKRKHSKISEANKKLQDALATGNEDSTLSLGASIHVSRFSSNALRILRRNRSAQVSTQPVMPQSVPLHEGPHIPIKKE